MSVAPFTRSPIFFLPSSDIGGLFVGIALAAGLSAPVMIACGSHNSVQQVSHRAPKKRRKLTYVLKKKFGESDVHNNTSC